MTNKELQIQIALGTAEANIRGDIGTWKINSNGVITETWPELNQVQEGTVTITIHGSDWVTNIDTNRLGIDKAKDITIDSQPFWDWLAKQLPD